MRRTLYGDLSQESLSGIGSSEPGNPVAANLAPGENFPPPWSGLARTDQGGGDFLRLSE